MFVLKNINVCICIYSWRERSSESLIITTNQTIVCPLFLSYCYAVQKPAIGQEGGSVQCSLHGLAGGVVQGPTAHPPGARQPPECPHLLLLNKHTDEEENV